MLSTSAIKCFSPRNSSSLAHSQVNNPSTRMTAAPPQYHHLRLPLALLLLSLQLPAAVSQSSPPPDAAPDRINVTGILEAARQFSSFIRFLNQTDMAKQIDNQVINNNEGMTLFAPTDNAFNNLPSGTLNNLSDQQQRQLAQYHVLPKYYTAESLQTVSNPVRTLATGQEGGFFGLNFTGGQGSQLNVSTGVVVVSIYNTVRKEFPLAVYQVDMVLIPKEFSEPRATPSPPPTNTARGGGAPSGSNATTPAAPGNGCGNMSKGLGLVSVCGLFFMGLSL